MKFIKPSIIVLLIIIVLILAHNFGLLGPFENAFFSVTKPIQQPLYNLSQKIFNKEQEQNLEELKEENKELSQRITQLLNENNKLKSLVDEYQELNEQLKYIEEKEYNSVPARIIAQSTDQASQSLIINQGSDQGLVEGLAVIVEKGYLIGKIDSVEKNRATVVLTTDNFCQFTAKVQEKENAAGITRGQHGLSLNLELIPKTEEIQEQEIVVTAGLEENIPAGLIVGEIEKIDNPPGELWQTAILNILFDLRQVDVVNIILPS